MDLFAAFGPWAVVTGASAGLGEQFARQLAPLGFKLVLVARRAERLETLAQELAKTHGTECRPLPLDLSAEGADARLDEATADLDVGLFVNNAGLGYYGSFVEQDRERLAGLVRLNCAAVALLAHRFARRLVARGRGAMVIVASTAAYQATPHMVLYGATKGFDLLLAEGLDWELRGTGVRVMALCPGATATEFQGAADGVPHPGADPSVVVRTALRSLGRRPAVIPGLSNKLVVHSQRLFPRRLVTFFGERVLRRFDPAGR